MKGVGGEEAIAFVTKKEVGTRLNTGAIASKSALCGDRHITGDPTLTLPKTQGRGPEMELSVKNLLL
ncbi:hypothetical protein [Oscillatoria acuminata]|uniref:hypothetical protein n=1 Tax=Oscillatoria acuminata TaxID=118323 RepID=UPI00030E82DE|nr:hypothetical protein [Oscillatoria acuminata]